MSFVRFASSFVALAALGACAAAPSNSPSGAQIPTAYYLPSAVKDRCLRCARSNYELLRTTQILDDRCVILKPDERTDLDAHIGGLTTFLTLNSADGDIPGLNDKAQSDANGVSCETAQKTVYANYRYSIGPQVEARRLVYVWAMDGGARCNNISREENSVLFQAWNAEGVRIRDKYGIPVFTITTEIENKNKFQSRSLSCSNIRRLINTALGMAASNESS